ncbi:hypothetical protein Ancab_025163 [Ancistrocladus abbreviatus]
MGSWILLEEMPEIALSWMTVMRLQGLASGKDVRGILLEEQHKVEEKLREGSTPYCMRRMNLRLPGEESDEITDFQEHGCALDGELDLNCPMDRKGSADANMLQKDMKSSYGNSNSHMQARNHGYHNGRREDDLQVKSFLHGAMVSW